MAILIPSKNIYNKQNPKVMDNVIERIEVGSVEVIPNNNQETVVYSGRLNIKQSVITGVTSGGDSDYIYINSQNRVTASGNIIYDKYATISEIKINKLSNNTLVSKIYAGLKSNDSSYTQVSKSIEEEIYLFHAEDGYYLASPIAGGDDNKFMFYDISIHDYKKIKIKKEEPAKRISDFGKYYTKISFDLDGETTVSAERKETQESDSVTEVETTYSPIYRILSTSTLNIDEPYKTQEIEFEETDDYFIIKNIKVLIQRDMYFCWADVVGGVSGEFYPASVVQIIQKAKTADISIYGETIGISLDDKTVYIPETDKTSKKVFSVDGNELMQTSNIFYEKGKELIKDTDYEVFETEIAWGDLISCNISLKTAYENPVVVSYLDEYEETRIKIIEIGEKDAYISYDPRGSIIILSVYETQSKNQLYSQFDKTKELYSNGKETATIRCSISDYYDYDSGEKVISIDNSTNKMSFKMYDKVIPMVYGADGKDHPMSLYKDGSEKVFEVLGSKIYYDGAVWQELSLQEV